MSGLTKDDLHSGRLRAEATDLRTDKVEVLTLRPGSACHFFEPFRCGEFRVRLRLDWNDPDDSGRPTLDADFYDVGTGQMDKSMRGNAAHQTKSSGGSERAYSWEFADQSRHLRVTLTWSVEMAATVRAVPSVSFIVTRAKRTSES